MIDKIAYDSYGNVLTPTPNFSFTIDGTISVTTNSNGFAQVNNLSPGLHTVSENVPSGWFLTSVSPANGVVNVVPGTQCVKVTFKNKQEKKEKPSCVITATPDHIHIHEDPELAWTSTNATSATLNQGIGSVAVNGTYHVFPEETTTYTLTVTGPGGTAQCSTTVTVTYNPPACEIWAEPQTVEYGGSTNLDWWADDATSVSVNHGVGVLTPGELYEVTNLTQTTTFTMTATGPGGTGQCSTTVTVTNEPPPEDEPFCDIWASDTTIRDFESTTLSWVSANAVSASMNQGIGSVVVNGSRIVSPDVTTTYTLTVSNGTGSHQCSVTIHVEHEEQEDEPSCDIWASDTSITDAQSTTLSWVSSNATSRTLNQGIGSVAVNGSRVVSPDHTTTYTLTVSNSSGSSQCSVTIVVDEEPPAEEAPSCDLTASDTHIIDGETTTLSWDSENATSLSLTSIGSVSASGSRTVSPHATKTYTLTVSNNSGESEQCRVTIVVEQHVDEEAPSCWIAANPGSVQEGNGTTLTWSSDNASSASISTIGSVNASGSRYVSNLYATKTYTMTVWNSEGESAQCSTKVTVTHDTYEEPSCWINSNPSSINENESAYLTWNSANANSASLSSVGSVAVNGSYTVRPGATKTYTLTVYGDNGQSAQCQTTVHVDYDNNNYERPSCHIYQAQQNTYWWNSGSSVQLSWDSDNTDHATLSGYGYVPTDGSKTVSPSYTTTYTLTVWGENGSTEQCSTTVHVNNDYDNHDYDRPSCTIQLSNYSGPNGSARLSWWSSDATNASISGIGSVNTSDSMTVYPDGNRVYTMTVYGQGGTATCHTSYVTPYLPPVIGAPYISLTQIPYTGFDFGPIGNAMYWLGMIATAMAGAYLVLYYRRNAFAIAGMQNRFRLPAQNRFSGALALQLRAFENVAELAAAPIRSLIRRS